MRLVGAMCTECACDQRLPVDIVRPCFSERTHQREQYRSARKRKPCLASLYPATAGVDHEGTRCEERRDLGQAQGLLACGGKPQGGGPFEHCPGLHHFRKQRRNSCALGGLVCAGERRLCRSDAQRAKCQLGSCQLRNCLQRRREATRIEICQRCRSLVQTTEQDQPPRRDQPRLQRIGTIFTRCQRGLSRDQGAHGAAEIAHGERHFGRRDHAAGARQFLVDAETTGSALQKFAGTWIVAELSHGDTAQCQCRRVDSQSDPLESAERIARGQGACRSSGQGIHEERLLHGGGAGEAASQSRINLLALLELADNHVSV